MMNVDKKDDPRILSVMGKRKERRLHIPIVSAEDVAAVAGPEIRQMAEAGRAADVLAVLERLVREVGESPRERLSWLIERLVYRPHARLREPALRRVWAGALAQVRAASGEEWEVEAPVTQGKGRLQWVPATRGKKIVGYVSPIYRAFSREDLLEAQRRVLEVLEAAAEGRPYAGRLEGVTVRALKGRYFLVARLPDAIVIATLKLLGQIPPGLLRRCAYGQGAGRTARACARVFVARKRQKYCESHRQDARREQLREAQRRHRRRTARGSAMRRRVSKR